MQRIDVVSINYNLPKMGEGRGGVREDEGEGRVRGRGSINNTMSAYSPAKLVFKAKISIIPLFVISALYFIYNIYIYIHITLNIVQIQ